MTFREAVRKKFWRLVAGRVLHLFEHYAREYEKDLDAAGRERFRRIFGRDS